MKNFSYNILPDYQIQQISHIGSTAIKDIWAKNIIDILIEIGFDGKHKNIYVGMVLTYKFYQKNGFMELKDHVSFVKEFGIF